MRLETSNSDSPRLLSFFLRIDANTDDIESNVTGAQTELLKYYSYVSSNRWLMVKVFAVLISSAVTLSVLS